MKKLIITLILACSGIISFSQKHHDASILLNNRRVDINSIKYLNPLSIESVNVDQTKRTIFYFTKKPVSFLTLDSVYLKYSARHEPINNIVYFVNDEFISVKDGVKIDASFFISLKEKKLSEANYINHKYQDLVIVEVTLSSTEIKPRIVLRGMLDSLIFKDE